MGNANRLAHRLGHWNYHDPDRRLHDLRSPQRVVCDPGAGDEDAGLVIRHWSLVIRWDCEPMTNDYWLMTKLGYQYFITPQYRSSCTSSGLSFLGLNSFCCSFFSCSFFSSIE